MPHSSASTLARTLLTLLRRLEAGWQTLDQLAQADQREQAGLWSTTSAPGTPAG